MIKLVVLGFVFAPAVISIVVGEMVDRSDLVTSHIPPAYTQDVLTVFQFHSYILQHAVQNMESHLLDLAREGQLKSFLFLLLLLYDQWFSF